jgi:hypothetical protein
MVCLWRPTESQPYAEALVVGPGDRLVINLGRQATPQEVDAAAAQFEELSPELNERVIIVNAEQLAVIRSEGIG